MENKVPIINRLNLFILYCTQASNKKISQSDLAKQLLTSRNNIIDVFNNADKLPDDLLIDIKEEIQNKSKTFNTENTRGRRI